MTKEYSYLDILLASGQLFKSSQRHSPWQALSSRGLDETHFTWLVVGGNAATVDIHGLHDCQATLWREVAHDLGSAALPYTDRRGSDLDLVAHKGGRFAAMLQGESIGENPAAERQR